MANSSFRNRTRHRRLSAGLIFMMLALLPVLRLSAQEAGANSIHEWIVREWNEAAKWPALGDFEFRFRLVNPLAQAEPSGAEHRNVWTRYRVWTGESDQVRISTDEYADDQQMLYYDIAVDGSAAWSISPEQIVIVDDTRKAEDAHDYQRYLPMWRTFTSHLLYGGFAPVNPSTTPPNADALVVNGDQWSFIVPGADRNSEHHFFGRWDEHLGRGFVERIEFRSTADPKRPQTNVTLIEGWTFDETCRRWIAASATMSNADGVPFYRIQFEEVLPFDRDSFAELLKVPALDAGATDPIRGSITASSVVDYRNNAWQQRSPDGTLSEIAPVQNSGTDMVTIAGRVILVLVGGIVLLVVLRRFRS